jgi:hypothetical protein
MTQISDPNMKINLIKENDVLYYELEIKNGKCKISYASLPKIIHIKNDDFKWDFKPLWYVHSSGYVMCTIPTNNIKINEGHGLLMHRYLLDELKTNKKVSIDHKNRIRSDNRLENLQLASQSFQNHNQKKKTRKEIDIPGFDKPIKLPEYIGYIKEPTLKEGEKKTGFKSLPAHFLVESKIFGFSKHASKSNKLSIKERLNDALTIRYSLIVDNTDDYELLFIDNKKFKDEKEFEKHNIDLINELCDTQINKITKVDLTAYNITKLSTFASSLTSHGNNTSTTTTTKPGEEHDLSYFVFNDEELEELAKLYDEEDKKANSHQSTKDEENYPYNSLEKYLYDIITARKNKTNRSIKNQLDLYIIKKLNDDIPNLNKKAASRVLFITDDYITRVLKNEVKLRYNVPITDSFLITTKFMDEYAKIKDEIITEMNSSVTKKLSGLKNIKDIKEKTKTRDWKLPVNTIINMIKDKNNISYREIAQKYKDINGQELTISDVQNVCSSGRSYWLEESDFINRTDISFDEYKTKRETDTIIIPKKKEQPNDAKYLELCKKNSIVKRTCDYSIMVDIFMNKYTILTASKTALKYKNKKGDTVSEALVKQIWSGTTSLFEDDFQGRTDITYQQYLIDVEKDKTTFSRPLEYQKKYDDLIEAVNQKQIISLNRTHIKTLELVGKDKKFINDLKILISNQI